ncbi:MAG: putative ABC-type ATPase [Phenylobacterium sp.]|jgi:predicted ABC-type ATPase
MSKSLWLLSGGNGAGKTTFFNQFLKPRGVAFVNADEIAKDVFPDAPEANSYNAAQIAQKMRYDLLSQGRSFCFETVFSHPSKIDFVAKAKALGYCINLVFIHVDNPDLNVARVINRVKEGGHTVPEDKIRTRLPRTLKNVAVAAQLSDNFIAFDNSSLEKPFQKVLTKKNGQVTQHIEILPDWCLEFVK